MNEKTDSVHIRDGDGQMERREREDPEPAQEAGNKRATGRTILGTEQSAGVTGPLAHRSHHTEAATQAVTELLGRIQVAGSRFSLIVRPMTHTNTPPK